MQRILVFYLKGYNSGWKCAVVFFQFHGRIPCHLRVLFFRSYCKKFKYMISYTRNHLYTGNCSHINKFARSPSKISCYGVVDIEDASDKVSN